MLLLQERAGYLLLAPGDREISTLLRLFGVFKLLLLFLGNRPPVPTLPYSQAHSQVVVFFFLFLFPRGWRVLTNFGIFRLTFFSCVSRCATDI